MVAFVVRDARVDVFLGQVRIPLENGRVPDTVTQQTDHDRDGDAQAAHARNAAALVGAHGDSIGLDHAAALSGVQPSGISSADVPAHQCEYASLLTRSSSSSR